jgi:hypothetical protein
MITRKNVRSHQIMLSTHMIGMVKAAAKSAAIPEGVRTPVDQEIIASNEREQKVFLADVLERTAELPKEIVKAPASKKPVVKKTPVEKLPVGKEAKHGKAKSK